MLSNYLQGTRRSSVLYDSFFSLSDDEPSPHAFTHPSSSPLCNVQQPPNTPPSPVFHSLTKPLDSLDLHSSSVQNFHIDPEGAERSLPSSPYPRRPRRLAVLVNDSDSLSRISAFIDRDPSSAFRVLDSLRVKETFDAFSRNSHAEEESSGPATREKQWGVELNQFKCYTSTSG